MICICCENCTQTQTHCVGLTFVYPCIASITVNDDQQDELFWLIYLFLISSTCFGRCPRPSSGAFDCIYSFWYCPPILLLAGVVDEMELEQHLTVFTASDFVHRYCCWLVSWMRWNWNSTWLYLQLLILSTDIAAGWCRGWDGTGTALDCIYSFWYCPPILLLAGVVYEMELEQFHLIHDTSRQQYPWKISEALNTVKWSWWWAKTSPRNI